MAVSTDGARLTYVAAASRSLRELVFLNSRRTRGDASSVPPQLGLDFPAISPDGGSVAVVAVENDNADLWVQDLARGTRRRLVASPRNELFPSWSRDGKRLVYGEEGDVEPTLKEVPADGIGRPAPRSARRGTGPRGLRAESPSCSSGTSTGQGVLWRLDTAAGAMPVRLTPSQTINEDGPTLSPDGRWLACMSDESGANQVFVRRLRRRRRRSSRCLVARRSIPVLEPGRSRRSTTRRGKR